MPFPWESGTLSGSRRECCNHARVSRKARVSVRLRPETGLMPQNFLACDREQSLLLPPDLREWLAEDHLAWFVIEVVAQLEVGSF